MVLVDAAHEDQYRRAPAEIRSVVGPMTTTQLEQLRQLLELARTEPHQQVRARLTSTGKVIGCWMWSWLFGHGLWDAIHHRRAVDTAMRWWYVPLCLRYDAVVGACILVRYR